jgi:hypothetical protein
MKKSIRLAVIGMALSSFAVLISAVSMLNGGIDGSQIAIFCCTIAVFCSNVVIFATEKKKEDSKK